MATYFNLEEYFEALEEDPDYDETVINDSMLAEYLAFLLDSSIEQNSSSSQLDIE